MEKSQKLIDYLPAVFRQPPAGASEDVVPFIEKFVQLFEEQFDQLESHVDKIPELFNPWKCDAKFLPWLASWLDLSLPAEKSERTKRSLIYNIFSIYRTRGTPEGLDTILRIYLDRLYNKITEDTTTPHVFVITVNFPEFKPAELTRRIRTIGEVVEREKPVHTDYLWEVLSPTMQINFHSTIGVDTILGTTPNPDFKKPD